MTRNEVSVLGTFCFRGLKIQEFLVDYIMWGDDVLLIDSIDCGNSEYVRSKKRRKKREKHPAHFLIEITRTAHS